jgi:hypothetical protein
MSRKAKQRADVLPADLAARADGLILSASSPPRIAQGGPCTPGHEHFHGPLLGTALTGYADINPCGSRT